MKKSRTLPALLSLVLALAMMLSLSVTAFAASPARASGNGYSMTKITIRNKPYDIVAAAGESGGAGYTVATCDDVLRIQHSRVSVQFDTTHYGYVSNSGGATIAWTTENVHSTKSGEVKCPYGAHEVEKIRGLSGTVTFYADEKTTLTVTLKNP